MVDGLAEELADGSAKGVLGDMVASYAANPDPSTLASRRRKPCRRRAVTRRRRSLRPAGSGLLRPGSHSRFQQAIFQVFETSPRRLDGVHVRLGA